MPKAPKFVAKVIQLLTKDIWRMESDDLGAPKAIFILPLKILLLTLKGYIRDNCALRASALTFYSILSVVPMVAMAFGIAKGFGLDQGLEKQLYMRFTGHEEVLAKIIDFARSLLENTKGGLIAGIGVAVLIWTGVKVLSHIEGTLNHIWKVSARSFIRKFADYTAIMISCPLLVIVSSSTNVFITTQVKAITGKLALLESASPVIFMMLKLLPFGLVWLLFIMIYMVMPNTQVRFKSAFAAGIICGSIYQIFQEFYIKAQVLVSNYNAIYGSFAALPLFLIWLQLSWMIVLLGAEIAYAHQHAGRHAMALEYQSVSTDCRRRLALYILRLIIKRFKEGLPPSTATQIAEDLKLPLVWADQMLDHLRESGLVSAVETKRSNGPAFQPARDIHAITIASVLDALDKQGRMDPAAESDPELADISRAVEEILEEMERSPKNRLVMDI